MPTCLQASSNICACVFVRLCEREHVCDSECVSVCVAPPPTSTREWRGRNGGGHSRRKREGMGVMYDSESCMSHGIFRTSDMRPTHVCVCVQIFLDIGIHLCIYALCGRVRLFVNHDSITC